MKINKVFNNKDKDESGIGSSLIRPLYNDKEVEKAVDVRVDELIPQPPTINRELVSLADYNRALDDIDSLLTQLEFVTNDNIELTSEVSRLQGEVTSLRAELDGMKNTNTGLQSSLSGIQSQLQTVMADLTAARQEANTAQSQAFMAQAEKLVAQSIADSLQQQVNTLTAALANAQTPVNVNVTGGGGTPPPTTPPPTTPPPTTPPPTTPPPTTPPGGGTDSGGNTEPPIIIPWTPTGDVPDIGTLEEYLNDPSYLVILAYSNVAPYYGIDSTGTAAWNQYINTPHIVIDTNSLPRTQIEDTNPNVYPPGDDFERNYSVGVFDLGGYTDFSNRFGSIYPYKNGTNYTQYSPSFPATTWGVAMVYKKPPADAPYVKNFTNGNLSIKLKLRTQVNKSEFDSIVSSFVTNATNTDNYTVQNPPTVRANKPFKDVNGNDKTLVYFEKDESIYSLKEFGINTLGVFDNNIFYGVDEQNIKNQNNRDLTSYELKDPRRWNILAEWNEWVDGNGSVISQNPNSEITISSSTVMMIKAKFIPYEYAEFKYGVEDVYNVTPGTTTFGATGVIYSDTYDWYAVVSKRRFLENVGKLELYQYPDSYAQYVQQVTEAMLSQTNPTTGAAPNAPSEWMYPGSFNNTTGGQGQASGLFIEDTNQDSFSPKVTIFDVSTQSQLNTATNSTLKGLVPTGESSAQTRATSYHIGELSFETELHTGANINPTFNTVSNFQQVSVDKNSGYVKIYASTGALLKFTKINTAMDSYMQFQSDSGEIIDFGSNFTKPIGQITTNSAQGYPMPKKSKYTLKPKNLNTNPSFTFNISSNAGSTNASLWDMTDSGLSSIINSAKVFNISDTINLSWDIPWWKYRHFVIYDFGDVSGILNANSLMTYGNVTVVDAETGNTIPTSQSTILQNSTVMKIINNSVSMFERVESSNPVDSNPYSTWSQKYNNITSGGSYYADKIIEWKQYMVKAPDDSSNVKQLWGNYSWGNDIYKIFDSKSTNTSYKINFNGDLNNLYSNSYRFIVLVGNSQEFGIPYSYNPDVYIIPIKWNTTDTNTPPNQEVFPNVVFPINGFTFDVTGNLNFEWQQMSNVIDYQWEILPGFGTTVVGNGVVLNSSTNSNGNVFLSGISAISYLDVYDSFRFRVRGRRLSGSFTEWSPTVSFNIN
jgi:hypothetical protein